MSLRVLVSLKFPITSCTYSYTKYLLRNGSLVMASCQSVRSFFTPAAKKCKYLEQTHQMADGIRPDQASMIKDSLDRDADGNMAWNSQHLGLGNQRSAQYFNSIPRNMPPGQHHMPDNASLGQYHNSEQLVAGYSWHETHHQRQQCEREQPSPGYFQQENLDNQINPAEQPALFSSPLELGRRWYRLHRTCYRQQRSQNFGFTVVSYNVLADGLLNAHSDLYAGTEQWLQQWEYRRRNLLKEILHYKADIVCLQEVEECHYHDWFEPKLREKGYSGVYKKRTGDKTDGCATFFKASRFTLVKTKLVSFRKPEVKLMDRDNVAVVLLLEPRTAVRSSHQAANSVCVSNTHLLFNKKRGDIKLSQLACLLAEIAEIAAISTSDQGDIRHHPIICCGDFNSVPFSPIYEFVVRGLLDYKGMHRDNFSGQNHFRNSFPPRQALSSNLIPWELGITTSGVKRNDSQKANPAASYEPSNSANSTEDKIKGGNSDCGSTGQEAVGNSAGIKKTQEENLSLISSQCSKGENSDIYLACSSTSLPNKDSQSLVCLEVGETWPEGELTAPPPTENKTEQDLYNACTTQQHPFNFFSVYRHYFKNRRPEVTTFHDRACTTVDYMFVSPGLQRSCRRCRSRHGPLQLTGKLDLLSEDAIWDLGGLPNKFLSSDHLSLVSSFLLHV